MTDEIDQATKLRRAAQRSRVRHQEQANAYAETVDAMDREMLRCYAKAEGVAGAHSMTKTAIRSELYAAVGLGV